MRVRRVEISSESGVTPRDVPPRRPRPRENILLLCFHGISYSRHEVTYLSGRKRLRGCIVVVKNSNNVPGGKIGRASPESCLYRSSPCFAKTFRRSRVRGVSRAIFHALSEMNRPSLACLLIKFAYTRDPKPKKKDSDVNFPFPIHFTFLIEASRSLRGVPLFPVKIYLKRARWRERD